MRWSGLSGGAFVACFIAAAVTYGSGAGRSSPEIAAYYASAGDRSRQLAGFTVLLAGAIALLLFAATLPGRVPMVSGAAAAVLLVAADTLWVGSAFTAHIDGPGHVSPAAHLMLEDTGFAFFVAAAATAIPLVAATALRRPSPRWFSIASLVAIGGLATSYWYFPWALFLIWVLATPFVLTRS